MKGRKRHILVDTNGFLLQVLVHEANIQDYDGGKLLLVPVKGAFPRLKLIWANSAYKRGGFVEWVKAELGWGGRDRRTLLEWCARGLGSKGCRDRLGEDPTQRLSCASAPLDCRAHFRLAFYVA